MRSILNSTLLAAACLITVSCQPNAKKEKAMAETTAEPESALSEPQDLSEYSTAYFASGCFWCVEAIFESVKGVAEAESGYAGGTEKNPTYEQVGYGKTTHAESVKVYYDPEEVSFFELVQVFFGSHDPTTLNRQGPDWGAQYRSIAFYQTEEERDIILAYMDALRDNKVYEDPIVTEVRPLTEFWKAEAYHQDYERKHPDNPYIQNISVPRLNRFKANFPDYLKENVH